jgi:hypothetical protein
MDRRERTDDPVEAQRVALEGKQAEMWTALPGIVESFNPEAMTAAVQPAIKGRMEDESGLVSSVNLPLLADVPVIFPGGGGFTLTYPIKQGDECLVVFSSRCMDGWWQNGGVSDAPDGRMHDLSDGFAIVGPRSQAHKLATAVDCAGVQLRSDDGEVQITMLPDYTITAINPAAALTLGADGTISAKANMAIIQEAPLLTLKVGGISMSGLSGEPTTADLAGTVKVDELISGDIGFNGHTHFCPKCGTTTSGPVPGGSGSS